MRPHHSLSTRALALSLCCSMVLLVGPLSPVLLPEPGMKDYQARAQIEVPGGFVNAAGGNLSVRRTDIETDTSIGRVGVGASYNSATGEWLFSFETSFDGTTFIDPTGAVWDVTGLAPGDAIPGSVWVYVDATTIRGKGGLRHEFDGSGRLSSIRWENTDIAYLGHTWSTDELVIRGCPGGCRIIYRVTFANGRPVRIDDEQSGRSVEYTWDGSDRLVQVRRPLDVAKGWTGFQYEYSGTLLTAITNSEGERIEYDYMAERRVHQVRQVGEGDPTHTFEYLAKNIYNVWPTIHTDPTGRQLRYIMTTNRRLVRIWVVGTGANVELYTYEGDAVRPSTILVPAVPTRSYSYENDDVKTITQGSGNVVTYTYQRDATNRSPLEDSPFETPIARIEDSLGLVEERSYDGTGMLTAITNGAGETESYTHGPIGQWRSVIRADGPEKNFSNGIWTFHGKPKQGERGWGTESYERFTHSLAGDRTVGSNGLDPEAPGVVSRGFDENRNLASITYASLDEFGNPGAQETVVLERRSDGQLTRIVRPGGGNHEMSYDALGRVVAVGEVVDGVLQTTTYEYDANGRRTATERPNGMREEIDYNFMGQPVARRTLQDGVLEGNFGIAYTGFRPWLSYDSIRNGYEGFAYDLAGRVQTRWFANGETITYGYDLRSRKTSEVFSLDGTTPWLTVEYEYDGADRETAIRVDGALVVDRSYVAGLLGSVRTGNGLERSFSYDPDTGVLSGSSTIDVATSTVVEDTTLESRGVNANPDRVEVVATTTTSGGVNQTTSETFLLDTGEDRGSRVFAWRRSSSHIERFAYSALGNAESVPGAGYLYNTEGNRLLSGRGISYSYDDAGYVTQRGGQTVSWTADGRIAQIGNRSFVWDMQRRLITLTEGGSTRDFSWFDGQIEVDPVSQVPIALELGDARIALSGGNDVYRHRDFRDNVKFTTDQDGEVLAHYRYGPYGVDAVFGSGGDDIRFVDRRDVGSVALLGARVYDPAIGRFLSPDPVLQVSEQYGYAQGNPVMFTDPDGENAEANIEFGANVVSFVAGVGATVATGPLGALLAAIAIGIGGLSLGFAAADYLSGPSAPSGPGGDGGNGDGASSGGLNTGGLASAGSSPGASAAVGAAAAGAVGGVGAGIGCAPTRVDEVPHHAGVLMGLLALQALLGIAVLRRRRQKAGA